MPSRNIGGQGRTGALHRRIGAGWCSSRPDELLQPRRGLRAKGRLDDPAGPKLRRLRDRAEGAESVSGTPSARLLGRPPRASTARCRGTAGGASSTSCSVLMFAGAFAELAALGAMLPFLTLLADPSRVRPLPAWLVGLLLIARSDRRRSSGWPSATALFIVLAIVAGAVRLQLVLVEPALHLSCSATTSRSRSSAASCSSPTATTSARTPAP